MMHVFELLCFLWHVCMDPRPSFRQRRDDLIKNTQNCMDAIRLKRKEQIGNMRYLREIYLHKIYHPDLLSTEGTTPTFSYGDIKFQKGHFTKSNMLSWMPEIPETWHVTIDPVFDILPGSFHLTREWTSEEEREYKERYPGKLTTKEYCTWLASKGLLAESVECKEVINYKRKFPPARIPFRPDGGMNSGRVFAELGTIPALLFMHRDKLRDNLVNGITRFLTDSMVRPDPRLHVHARRIKDLSLIVKLIESDQQLLTTFMSLGLSNTSNAHLRDVHHISSGRQFANKILGILWFYLSNQDMSDRPKFDIRMPPNHLTNAAPLTYGPVKNLWWSSKPDNENALDPVDPQPFGVWTNDKHNLYRALYEYLDADYGSRGARF